jgi:SAM-dependent methyltransferase
MDDLTAAKLVELTNNFYTHCAQSFSQTRAHAWDGWEQAFKEIKAVDNKYAEGVAITTKTNPLPIDVLDLACGNMRFCRFLEENAISAQVCAVDSCEVLHALGSNNNLNYINTNYIQLDIISALASDTLSQEIQTDVILKFDLSVCFGFFHHLPQYKLRERALLSLVNSTKSNGFVVIAFWQFTNSERLLKKALEATRRAKQATGISLNPNDGDFFLGWQDDSQIFRYCHSYSEDEINMLLTPLEDKVREVARFSADGKSHDLNRYVVLQVV